MTSPTPRPGGPRQPGSASAANRISTPTRSGRPPARPSGAGQPRASIWTWPARGGIVLTAVALGLILFRYVPYHVPTASMAPALAPGDWILADRWAGGAADVGDIVIIGPQVWPDAASADETIVKRVAAVPGTSVTCCDAAGRWLIAGQPREGTQELPSKIGGLSLNAPAKITVPAERVFLLGDNPGVSADSRTHLAQQQGTVATSDIQARVVARFWPSGRATTLGPLTFLWQALGAALLGLAISGVTGLALLADESRQRSGRRR